MSAELLSPRATLWHDLIERLPPAEHAEMRSVLGETLVAAAEDTRAEFEALADVFKDIAQAYVLLRLLGCIVFSVNFRFFCFLNYDLLQAP
jgi:hypothetical protein